jgi:hypothetical protein
MGNFKFGDRVKRSQDAINKQIWDRFPERTATFIKYDDRDIVWIKWDGNKGNTSCHMSFVSIANADAPMVVTLDDLGIEMRESIHPQMVLDEFRKGLNTFEIAKKFRQHESIIYNLLSKMRG